jgi:hypothetical protein
MGVNSSVTLPRQIAGAKPTSDQMPASVRIVACEQQQSSANVVLEMHYDRCRFELMVEAKPQGSLADACRTELRKLFDGLLDWELSGGAVTEARSPAAENGGAPP